MATDKGMMSQDRRERFKNKNIYFYTAEQTVQVQHLRGFSSRLFTCKRVLTAVTYI